MEVVAGEEAEARQVQNGVPHVANGFVLNIVTATGGGGAPTISMRVVTVSFIVNSAFRVVDAQ